MLRPGKMVRKRQGFVAGGMPAIVTGLVVSGPYIKILKISSKAQAETFVVDVLVGGQVYEEIPVAELEIV